MIWKGHFRVEHCRDALAWLDSQGVGVFDCSPQGENYAVWRLGPFKSLDRSIMNDTLLPGVHEFGNDHLDLAALAHVLRTVPSA